MQCGIACLQMVCRYYGLKLPLSELSRRCSATVEGVSLLGISEAAQGLGLHTICGRVTAEMLREAPLPCILHWNQNHFVVLYKVRHGRKFYVADPAKGGIVYGYDEFCSHWISTRSKGEDKGVAMFLEPTPVF